MNQFQSYRFFQGMKIPHLSLLIKCASETTFQAGEILFKEGDPVTDFFLIKTGSLALHLEPIATTREVQTVQGGDVVGWSCLIPRATWHLTGKTLGPMAVTVLDGGRLLAAAKENPEFGRELLQRAAHFEARRLDLDGALPRIRIEPLASSALQRRAETITGNSPFFSKEALDLAPSDAQQLSLYDGQWVRLTDQHGTTILPVHIKRGKTIDNITPRYGD